MSKKSVFHDLLLPNGGIQLILLGVYSNEIKNRIAKQDYDELVLGHGDWTDLSFIEQYLRNLKCLRIRTDNCDWPLISKLGNLEELSIRDENYDQLDFSKFYKLKKLSLFWSKRLNEGLISIPSLEILKVNKWGGQDLAGLKNFTSLKELTLIDSYKMCSCNGLQDLELESLEIVAARKLNDLNAISSLKKLKWFEIQSCNSVKKISNVLKSDNLKLLNIDKCKNIEDIQELGKKNLKGVLYLGIFDIPSISSLDFVKNFESIDAIMLGGTNVVDGNLEILLDLKTLRLLEGKNKRHYKPSLKEIQNHLEQKWGDKFTWDIQPWKD